MTTTASNGYNAAYETVDISSGSPDVERLLGFTVLELNLTSTGNNQYAVNFNVPMVENTWNARGSSSGSGSYGINRVASSDYGFTWSMSLEAHGFSPIL